MTPEELPSKMKNVRLTALAEFDLIEAQDFYEGEDAVVKAILDDRFGPARISTHFGPHYL